MTILFMQSYLKWCIHLSRSLLLYTITNQSSSSLIQQIVEMIRGRVALVDMGSGNAEKTRIIMDALLEKQSDIQYIPVDISESN